MKSIRRLYMFIASAVSLQVVAWFVISVIRQFVPPGEQPSVDELSLAIAVLIIGTPVFLVHWLWAQRSARESEEERGSTLRRLYLYGIMGGSLAPLVANVDGVVSSTLRAIFDLDRPGSFTRRGNDEMIVDAVLAILVLAAVWFYHWRVAETDKAAVGEDVGMAAVRRLYSFVFSGAGLVMTFLASTRLLRWVLYQIDGSRFTGNASEALVSEEVARLLTGLALWLVFWLIAQRLFAGDETGERSSALRKFYLYTAVFAAVMILVTNAAMILTGLFRRLFDLPSIGDVRDPLPLVIGGAAAWAYHARVIGQDALVAEEMGRQALVRRIYFYLVAAVGLAATLVGLAGDASVLIRALDRSGGLIIELREQLAIFTAALIAGLPVWLLSWRPVQKVASQVGQEGNAERRSIARQIYLYFFILVATLTVLASAIYFVAQIVSLILGGRGTGGLLSDVGQAIAFTIIGVGVWLYHGYLLRSDGRLRRAAEARQLAEWRVAVVDSGDGQLGQALLNGLRRDVPGLQITPLGLGQEAAGAMNGPAELAEAIKSIAEAQIVIGPWTMAVAGASRGAVSAEVAEAVAASPAHKLLLPVYEENWAWAGVDRMDREATVKQAVHGVKQIVAGEEVGPDRPLSIGVIIAIVVGLLIVLPALIMPLILFFVEEMGG